EDLFSGVTPLVELHGTVSVLSRAIDVAILGTTPNYATVHRNLRILQGRFLDQDDIEQSAKVCVVSNGLYQDLFGNGSAGDQTIHTLGMSFRVIALFAPPGPPTGHAR